MKIFDMINSSRLHLLNSVPTNSSLCYQNKINCIIFSKNQECNMFCKLPSKRENIDFNYRQYINTEISSRFHLVLISLKIQVNRRYY